MKWILRIFKKKSFWAITIIIVIAVIVVLNLSGSEKVEYVTEKVEKGVLTQTVSETGAIEAATEIDLNFKGNGTITEINVAEGDEVKAGDVLARLDAGQFAIQVRQAQAGLSIAQANLNRLLAGTSDENINVTQETVNNAEIAYDNAKRDHEALIKKIDNDIANYEEAVKIAQTNLQDTLNSSDNTISNSRNNLMTNLSSAFAVMGNGMDIIETIFNDPDVDSSFSAKNLQYKSNAKNYQETARDNNIPAAQIALSVAQKSLSDADIDNAYTKVSQALSTVKLALDNMFMALSATSADYNFNEAELNAYKSSVKLEQSSADATITSLDSSYQAYQNSYLNYESYVNAAKGNLDTAKNNLQTAISNKDLQIANSQSGLDNALGSWNLAKAQLELAKAPARNVDIAYYQAQVSQAQATLDLANSNLDDYIIYAPRDGVVTFVNYDVGEQVGFGITDITEAARAVISMLGVGDFEIDVDVPESDITKIKLGNEVNITLDAFGDDYLFNGKVIFIDLSETNIQGVVYYKVKVELDEVDLEIKPGMTANLDILTNEKENVLYVPNRAIKQDNEGRKYVEVLENGQPKQVTITTGLRGDQGTEILSGLKDGDEVIIFTKEN